MILHHKLRVPRGFDDKLNYGSRNYILFLKNRLVSPKKIRLWSFNLVYLDYCNLNINQDQLSSIRNVTIAGLICNNYDLTSVQKYPFLYASKNDTDMAYGGGVGGIVSISVYGEENRILPCERYMEQIDFKKWVEK